MEICNGDYGSHTSKLVESIENGRSNVWRLMKTCYLNKEIITSQQMTMRLYSFETEFKYTPYYTANFWKQLCILIKRNAIRLFRDRVILLYLMNLIYKTYFTMLKRNLLSNFLTLGKKKHCNHICSVNLYYNIIYFIAS